MKRLFIMVGMTVGGWAGWAVAARFGPMTAFLVSSLGSLAGVLIAWRIARDWLG
ncbi:MAG: hypothetical protein IT347_10180 [Candidatus Eisenbacteria bacterium]|nr:hypothetical protein [Candidatus Eisenbacteria bacterium]